MKKWTALMVFAVSLVCFSGMVFANVNPIVGPFPVIITQPGNYQLQKNLEVPNGNSTAILVQADNVTIDMSGNAILGPNVCTGSGRTLVCNNKGTGKGIDAGAHRNLKVFNGTIRGMGSAGISNQAGSGAIIEGMRVDNNGVIGIDVGVSSVVTGNTVNNNGTDGILVFSGVVSGNTAMNNGSIGIDVLGGTVNGNTAFGNLYGLYLGDSAGYVNNVLFSNEVENVHGGVNLYPNLCDTAPCP